VIWRTKAKTPQLHAGSQHREERRFQIPIYKLSVNIANLAMCASPFTVIIFIFNVCGAKRLLVYVICSASSQALQV